MVSDTMCTNPTSLLRPANGEWYYVYEPNFTFKERELVSDTMCTNPTSLLRPANGEWFHVYESNFKYIFCCSH